MAGLSVRPLNSVGIDASIMRAPAVHRYFLNAPLKCCTDRRVYRCTDLPVVILISGLWLVLALESPDLGNPHARILNPLVCKLNVADLGLGLDFIVYFMGEIRLYS